MSGAVKIMKIDQRRLRPRPLIGTHLFVVVPTIFVVLVGIGAAQVGSFSKAQVADRIRKVEDGVDEFRKYLEARGDNARDNAQTAQNSGASRRGRANSSASESRQQRAGQTKDDLDEALGDMNRSTNRLRRKFDPASNYMETRVQVEQVMDDARRVNQVMVKGKYGSQPERYWAALRANVTDLARCYGLTP